MQPTQFTTLGKTIFLLPILLYFIAYLFQNILPALTATMLLIFLIYAKEQFEHSIQSLSIHRSIIEPIHFAHHSLNIKTEIQNQGGPLHISATEQLPDDTLLLSETNTLNTFFKAGQTHTLTYQLSFTTRGRHTIKTTALQLTDSFHLYTTQTTQKHPTTLMIHSDPQEIKKAKQISTREHIELTLPSMIGTETHYEMDGIRTYTPGDLLRDIDWKATARLQKLMTKLFQKQEISETTILIDCARSMRRITTGKPSKLEHATILAIHLTKILQSLRHPVGLIAYDEYKTLTTTKPTYTHHQIYNTLTSLPTSIPTTQYTIPEHTHTTSTPPTPHRFLQKIYPFLAQGRRTIHTPAQASGIYEALRTILIKQKSKHLIILTDMETNTSALTHALLLAHQKNRTIWLLPFFTPYYHLDKEELTTEQLEHLYQLHKQREHTLTKLKRKHINIVELTPKTQGGKIIETIRKK